MTVFMWRCVSLTLIVAALVILSVTSLKVPETLSGWRSLTGAFIGVWLFQLFAYDVVARLVGGNDATVSAVLLDASKLWPIIPLLFGILIGHIWWAVR